MLYDKFLNLIFKKIYLLFTKSLLHDILVFTIQITYKNMNFNLNII